MTEQIAAGIRPVDDDSCTELLNPFVHHLELESTSEKIKLLNPNEKLNSKQYCQEVDKLKAALQKKGLVIFNRKDNILFHGKTDNMLLCGLGQTGNYVTLAKLS
ncbi:hypothetical protein QE152_g33486 [Popillia japonica]|uniref:Uncharacterized protein n=1 Tax=Popillia japonica TaxID=7064 RepID=A0AAW1IWZ9_POPJA